MTEADTSATRSPDTLRVALVQLTSGADRDRNREVAGRLVAQAAQTGARLVALPERWPHIDRSERLAGGAEPLDGPSLTAARGWAREHGVAILAGSVAERSDDPRRSYNTSVLIGPDGAVAATYRKLHLFDVSVGGVAYRESAATRPGGSARGRGGRGDEAVVVGQALGRRVGLSVCYDLRFPELYRRQACDLGAEILAVPSAFTAATGPDHWEPLLRARAIENQCFVLAPGQWGTHADGTASHGRSLVIDPWGVVLAQAPDGETIAVADLDFAAQRALRARMPVLTHRRPDVYG